MSAATIAGKGLDTNVLVRYRVQDDPKQAALATYVRVPGASLDQPLSSSLPLDEPGRAI